MVALLADRRGQPVPGPLPVAHPAGRRAVRDHGPAIARRRGGPARPERAGRRLALLRARHVLGQPGPGSARVLDRLRRQREVHAAGEGPAHRRGAAGRGARHLLRHRLVPGRLDDLLHEGRRGDASVPGVAAPTRDAGGAGPARARGGRRAVLRRRPADAQRGLDRHGHRQQDHQRGVDLVVR